MFCEDRDCGYICNEMSKKLYSPRLLLRYALIGLCVIISVFLINNYRVSRISSDTSFDVIADSEIAAEFHLSEEYTVDCINGEPSDFDLGSRHSIISQQTLDRIIASNRPYDISLALIYTKDVNGNYKLYTHKVTTDISLPNPHRPDSLFWIHNAELLIDNTLDHNVLGMDILRHFAVERHFKANKVILHFKAPETDYQEVCKLQYHNSLLGSLFGNEINRASVSLIVNDEKPHVYFFDSGQAMRLIEIVQPERNIANATGRIETDTVTGLLTQRRCQVKFGNRLRFSKVVYDDNIHTDGYGINPMKFFNQDCVIDIPGQRLLIRKP